jgi:SAM-dependent methyltransferase
MLAPEREYYEFDGFWDPVNGPLGEFDRRRVEEVWDLLPSDVRSILDLACGNGIFCNFVSKKDPTVRVVAVDRSKAAIRYVATNRVLGDMSCLPFANEQFDCVAALEVLEHLPVRVLERAKQEIARLARNWIVVCVPNGQQLGDHMTTCPECKTTFDPDLHMRSFDAAKLKDLFSSYGYVCKQVKKVGRYHVYVGLESFQKVRRNVLERRKPSPMESPLCPVCGYQNASFLSERVETIQANASSRRRLIRRPIRAMVKTVWPQVDRARWIAALYTRDGRNDR